MEIFTLAGQVIIGVVYILGAVSDLIDREALHTLMERKRIPYINYLLPGAIGLKVVCSLLLIFNILPAVGAFFLAGFTLIANVIFHPFWFAAPNDRKREYFAFMVNMAVVGGLLVIVGK